MIFALLFTLLLGATIIASMFGLLWEVFKEAEPQHVKEERLKEKRDKKIKKIKELQLFYLEAGRDKCPICDSELIFTEKSIYRRPFRITKITHCEKGCFARCYSDTNVRFFVFDKFFSVSQKVVESSFLGEKINMNHIDYMYSESMPKDFNKMYYSIYEHRITKSYVAEWLEGNVFKWEKKI